MQETRLFESMTAVDLSEIKIPMAVIYSSPRDFQGKYLCRIWEGAGCRPTNTAVARKSLEDLREDIQAAGFCLKFQRADGDDPVIVETWMR